jgi:hypothetical protein
VRIALVDLYRVHLYIGVREVRIILHSDPMRIRILRIWRRTFNIYVDMDNPNPIVRGCGVGYGINKIQ